MGQYKPRPIKLQLSIEDLARYGIKQVDFTPAEFDSGRDVFSSGGSVESLIVTSTGNFFVKWNFRKVRAGHVDAYKIHPMVFFSFLFSFFFLLLSAFFLYQLVLHALLFHKDGFLLDNCLSLSLFFSPFKKKKKNHFSTSERKSFNHKLILKIEIISLQ